MKKDKKGDRRSIETKLDQSSAAAGSRIMEKADKASA